MPLPHLPDPTSILAPAAVPLHQRPPARARAPRLSGLGVILCTLAACGGGSGSGSKEQAGAAASRQQAQAIRAASDADTQPVAVSNELLFLWAQATYPQLFPDSPPIASADYLGRSYAVRGYANGNFLGVSEGQAYGIGPFTHGELVNFGPLSNFVAQVCDRVGCGTSRYAQGAIDTAVTVGAPSPTSLTRTVPSPAWRGRRSTSSSKTRWACSCRAARCRWCSAARAGATTSRWRPGRWRAPAALPTSSRSTPAWTRNATRGWPARRCP